MRKKVKKWGDSLVITFTSQECEIYGIVEGDVIELDDMLIEKSIKKR